MNNKKKISVYINQLNKEVTPKEHKKNDADGEFEEISNTVRRIKLLREPVMPEEGYEKQLINSVIKEKEAMNRSKIRRLSDRKRFIWRRIVPAMAAILVIALFMVIPRLTNWQDSTGVVKAMERAYDEVRAYHGILEMAEINALGEIMVQSRREVWADTKGNYYIAQLDDDSQDIVTVNNGLRRWQMRPDEEKVYLFSANPDPYRFSFELGAQVMDITKAQMVKKIGQEMLIDRDTDIYEITPDGGLPYHVWIDRATNLPIKKETAMQNALQMKMYYTDIEFMDTIPDELLDYKLPQGFEEVDANSEQVVNAIEEAENMAGFMPKLPAGNPGGYFLWQIVFGTDTGAVKLIYKNMDNDKSVTIVQEKTEGKLNKASDAILGMVNNTTAEILYNYQGIQGIRSIRWHESEMEYTVYGNEEMGLLAEFAEAISDGAVLLPSAEEAHEQPQIEVPYDMEVEENEQKSVDAGHSPWRLDPAFVAQVFANLLLSPGGIEGDYEIPYEDIEIIKKNGVKAVAKIENEKSIAEYVHLERLVRQDETGIWTVVGYDSIKD